MNKNKWKLKTLEKLENKIWETPSLNNHLVTTCHKLCKKPINQFEVEDLRIMIGQKIGLKYLLPFAIEKLKKDLFISGDFYEGDLLQVILKMEKQFWIDNPIVKNEIDNLIKGKEDEMEKYQIEFDEFLK